MTRIQNIMKKNVTKNGELPDIEDIEDVRELESYIREFSVFLPMPVCMVTPVNIIVDANNAFRKLSGYDEMDAVGRKVEFFFRDKKKINNLIRALHAKGEVRQKEMEFMTKRGDIIYVSVSATLRRDIKREVVGYFLALSDITDLKKLQNGLKDKVRERTEELEKAQKVLIKVLEDVKSGKEKIEKEKNKTAAIISNFLDPVIVVDNGGRIMLLNPEARRVFRLSDKDLGRRVDLAGDRFSFEGFSEIIKKVDFSVQEVEAGDNPGLTIEEVVIKAGKIPSSSAKEETRNPFRIGITKYNRGETVYKVMTAPVRDEKGVCYGYMKIFYDLTREKMIDMLKSEFISIAAHQLRTPLSAIKWSVKMVLDGDAGELNEEQKKILWNGYFSNERVINLINEMLYVSRIEEGKFGYEFRKEEPDAVLGPILKDFSDQAKSKKIRLIVNLESELPDIYMDAEKMDIAIRHLLENAVKYTPESGTIRIDVRGGKKSLEIKIKDNGVGIPAKARDKLFTKFFRADNVVRMQTEGSGLGLFIAKNIVDEHHGTISCRSEEGKGTEMTITLPVKKEV